jgi:hypothetical protein
MIYDYIFVQVQYKRATSNPGRRTVRVLDKYREIKDLLGALR